MDRVDFLSLVTEDVAVKVLREVEDPETLLQAAQVCKSWRSLIKTDAVWDAAFARSFPTHVHDRATAPAGTATAAPLSSLQLYKQQFILDRNWRRNARRTSTLSAHRAWVNAVKLSPAGAVVSGGSDEQLMIWGLDGECRHAVELGDGAWCVDAGSRAAVVGDFGGRLTVVDLSSGRRLASLSPADLLPQGSGGRLAAVTAAQLLPGEQLLLASCKGQLSTWDLRIGGVVQQLGLSGGPGTRYASNGAPSPPPSRGFNRHAAFSARSHDHMLLAGDELGGLHVYDTRTPAKQFVLPAHSDKLFTMSLQWPRLATGSEDRAVRLWDLSRLPSLIAMASGRSGGAQAAADTSSAAAATAGSTGSGATDQAVDLAQAMKNCCLGKSTRHTDSVFSVSLSPDWRLVSASQDGTVVLHDAGLPWRTVERLSRDHYTAAAGVRAASGARGDPLRALPLGFDPAMTPTVLPMVWSTIPSLDQPPAGSFYGTAAGVATANTVDQHVDAGEPPDLDDDLDYYLNQLGIRPSAVHGADLSDTMLAVGGRDSVVKLYDFTNCQQ